ncbi:MAG: hypothetical protein Q9157_001504 [Trypethelium eluteriae]
MESKSEPVPPRYEESKSAFPQNNEDAELGSDADSLQKGDVLSLESVDPVLNAKMHMVNNTIDEIGFTPYHGKLFILNGFGYAVDSLILLIQSIIAQQASYEFNPSWTKGLTAAVYVGMLVGALFWGLSADIIGRKFAFNFSLMVCSIFAIIAGASPNWIVLGLFACLSAFGGGGNLVLDTAVFLEYLPGKQQWLITMMAAWWGLGQLIAGLFAWAYLPNFSCSSVATCTYHNNKGWRYVWYSCGALVFVMSVLRITVIRLKETPKFLLGEGKDEEVVEVLTGIAAKYNRPCSLTVERLQACGLSGAERRASVSAHAVSKWSPREIWVHLAGLYATKRIGLSTTLIWFSWLLIGLAYPLYNVYLPLYLESRGAQTGDSSEYLTWRNYAIVNVCGIFGPVLAGIMCASRWFWGRRGTMIFGALITMVFFFAFTQVRTGAQNLGFNCAISFCLVRRSNRLPFLSLLAH